MARHGVISKRVVAVRPIFFLFLLGLWLLQAGCAATTTRVADIDSNLGYMINREVTLSGMVVQTAVEPQEIRKVLEILRFAFPQAADGLPRKHYYFKLDDTTGAVWVVSLQPAPLLGRRILVRGIVREVVALPMLGSYNLVDIGGWKTLLPGEVTGEYIIVE